MPRVMPGTLTSLAESRRTNNLDIESIGVWPLFIPN